MKIAQVCPYDFSRPGGVKNHIINLAKELRLLGHEVKIISPHSTSGSVDPEVNSFGKNRSVHFSGTKIDVNIALGKESKSLKKFLKEEDFDIIHYHTFWNPVLPFQVWLNSKAINIATFHDTPKSKLVGKTLMPLAARLVFKMMDQVISVSETQARYIGGLSHQKVKIIPNGIDLSFFSTGIEKLKEFKDDKFNLLFLGRLEPRKGVMYALKAFAELKKQNSKLRLIIAGDGQERPLVESFITTHDLADVILMGQVSEEAKLSLLTTADLYLAPAIYGESFGIVLLEAMGCGLPIVGFGNEGYLNIIPNEWKSFFPEPQNLEGFISAIKTMIDDTNQRSKMKDWGLEEVKKYDWKILTKQIEDIYQSGLK